MEKKKAYVKPSMESETFVPNAYCSQCGDHGVTYYFECTAGGGAKGDIFLKDGTNLTKDGILRSSWFEACMVDHSSPKDDVYQDGYLILNGGNDETRHWVGLPWNGHWEYYTKIPVKIWTGDGSVHATANLDQDDWTIAKS